MKNFYFKISLILLALFIITFTQNFTNALALDVQEGIAPIYANDSQLKNISPSTHNQIADNQFSKRLTTSSSNADSQTGWVLKNGDWYFMVNGKAKSGWIWYNDSWYFCDENGVMKTSWIFDGKWYFLLSSGKMHTGWHFENGNWYYMDIDGAMITGLRKIDGVWYFFELNGKWSEDKTMSDEGGSFVDQHGRTISYKKLITGSCTAYTASPGAITSIGLVPKVGYVAVNPNIIPYGTKMYVCSKDGSITYGYAVAADTGGAMLSGKRLLDLYYDTEYECIQFGVQNMNIYILD